MRDPAATRWILAVAIATALGMLALPVAATGAARTSADAGTAHGHVTDATSPADGHTVTFDAGMLAGGTHSRIDLARFQKGQVVLPGTYNLDVYINQGWVARMNVRFASPRPGANAVPCITSQFIQQTRLEAQVAAARKNHPPVSTASTCVPLARLIPGARVQLDMARLRLEISIPQALMGNQPRGWVDPSQWNQGISAFLLNYRFNTYRSDNHGLTQNSTYLGLDMGLNLGPWQLRQRATMTWVSGRQGAPAQRQWHNIEAYARRALPDMRATLTVGDSHTDGAVFDSVSLRGVQLATDDRMLPQSRRGYAPVVRGTANSNAKVSVRQHGVLLYTTTVSPGPFVIDDLYPSGYGGDLEVTVTEADGSQRSFRVPYASVSQLMRPGITRYGVAFGQLRDMGLGQHPNVLQGTIQHGFTNRITVYAGFQGSSGYAAALLGGALNTRAGAFALDITEAATALPGHDAHVGQSWRLGWSKIIPSTRTSLGVAAYRYSTRGFFSLRDAALARYRTSHGVDPAQYFQNQGNLVNGVPLQSTLTPAQLAALAGNQGAASTLVQPLGMLHQRSRLTLSLNQPLGDGGGSVYANASYHSYWNQKSSDTSYQVGYNNHIGRLGFSLSASRSRAPSGRHDNRFFLNLSVPLGTSAHTPMLSANLSHDNHGAAQQQVMLNGSAGSHNQFNYGASVAHANHGTGTSGSINAGYRGSDIVLGAGYGKGPGFSQASFNASGAVLVHAGGVTLGQPTGDTVGLIHAPGAAGAQVQSTPGASIDRNGYALVPYLMPYQRDIVRLSPEGLPLGVQLEATSASTAPYAGAVVRLDFKTRYGRAMLVRIQRADGTLAPFGSEVTAAAGKRVGVVGQGGRALLRVDQPNGQLAVHWQGDDEQAGNRCRFDYQLPSADKASSSPSLSQLHVTCTAADSVLQARAHTP